MIAINITVYHDEEAETVTLSRKDWQKVLDMLKTTGEVNQIDHPVEKESK